MRKRVLYRTARPIRLKELAAILALAAVAPAGADLVNETETDGSASNNTLAAAQTIAPMSFTPNVSPSVFGSLPTATVIGRGGDDDVDYFSFQAGPGPAYFDIDNDPLAMDTYLALFDSAGTLLGDADDSFPADPGSASDRDAFLGVINLASMGTYYIAVARFPNFATATFSGADFAELVRPDGEFGGYRFEEATPGDSSFDRNGVQSGVPYTLHITIPEPSMAVFALVGAIAACSRRRLGSVRR